MVLFVNRIVLLFGWVDVGCWVCIMVVCMNGVCVVISCVVWLLMDIDVFEFF